MTNQTYNQLLKIATDDADWNKWLQRGAWGIGGAVLPLLFGAKPWVSLLTGALGFAAPDIYNWWKKPKQNTNTNTNTNTKVQSTTPVPTKVDIAAQQRLADSTARKDQLYAKINQHYKDGFTTDQIVGFIPRWTGATEYSQMLKEYPDISRKYPDLVNRMKQPETWRIQ